MYRAGCPTAADLRIKRSSSSQNFKYYLNSPPDLLSESEPLLENQMLGKNCLKCVAFIACLSVCHYTWKISRHCQCYRYNRLIFVIASESGEPTPRHEKRDIRSTGFKHNVYPTQPNLMSQMPSLSPTSSSVQPDTSNAQYMSPVSLSPLHSNANLFPVFNDGEWWSKE